MSEQAFDLVVVGAGPGGYVAAIRASQLGMRAAVVERAHLGGICLNWGCIPTKALLRCADLYRQMRHADQFGLVAPEVRFDIGRMVKRSRDVAAQLSGGVKHLLRKNRVAVIDGHGRLDGPGRVRVSAGDGNGSQTLTAPHIILATGARPRVLPGLEPDGELVWTYKEALLPRSLPGSLLVIGSGAIGIEFASFYRTFGTEVTVVELQDRILPAEDAEISALAYKAFERQGMRLLTGARVDALGRTDSQVTATVTDPAGTREITVERVLSAVGIVGNVENISLETTRVRTQNGHILVDAWGQTDEPGLYAIGDVVGPPWLAHKASHEAVLCVEHLAGRQSAHPLDPRSIPACTYAAPQIASLGLTEAKATSLGHRVRVGRFPFRANGKAIASGEPDGLVKTVFDADTGELLGAHMIGAEVTELIQGYAVAKTMETTETELMRTVFPHPTLSEAMHEAVLDAYGRTIHF